MERDRWQQVKKLYEAALELEAGERTGFLERACGSDKALRRELESLLRHRAEPGGFMEQPAFEAVAGMFAEGETQSLLGRQIGSYRILASLGAGGMGEVYLAEDSRLGRKVALKLLPPRFGGDLDRVRRFEREARAASALNHPNIVTIYEIGESEAGRYIARELVEGVTLREVVTNRRSMSQILHLVGQMAKALAVAHAAGILHRDIKPENAMVRHDGYLKLLDFGLARLSPLAAAFRQTGTTAETQPGARMGTLSYMSPEQLCAEPATNASDIFSLGVVAYELGTGRHPFACSAQTNVINAIITQKPTFPSRLNSEISSAFDELVMKMLEKDPRQRPTACEVDRALTEISEGRSELLALMPRKRQIVGRDREIRELFAGFESATSGHGRLLCLTGEPGIGKTALVESFLTDLVSGGASVSIARGSCSERLVDSQSYLPFLDALESLLLGSRGASAVSAMRSLAPTWYRHVSPSHEKYSGAAPEGIEVAPPELKKRELRTFFQEVSSGRTLVLFLDDLQWADLSTVDMLAYLAASLGAMHILIVVTYRPTDLILAGHPFKQLEQELAVKGISRIVPLGFLAPADVKAYLDVNFPGHRFPELFPALIHSKTEGNPLFMVDLLHYLREQNVISGDAGSFDLSKSIPDFEQDLPESVRSMIQKKIGQLQEPERRLLAAASVEGQEFDSAVVAGVSGFDAAEAEEMLDRLEQVHAFVRLIGEKELPDGVLTQKYRFVHVLYQNLIYRTLRPTRRASLSAAVADAIASHYSVRQLEVAADLALLYEAARDFRRASEHFLAAAQNATRVFGYRESVLLARRGLDMVARIPESAETTERELLLQIILGVALTTIQGYATPEAKEAYSRANDLQQRLGFSSELLPAISGLGAFHFIGGDVKSAKDSAMHLHRLVEGTKNQGLLGWSHWVLGLVCTHEGEITRATEHLRLSTKYCDPRQVSMYLSLFAMDPLVGAWAQLGRVHSLAGYPEAATEAVQTALARAAELSHPYCSALGHFMAAWTCNLLRDHRGTEKSATASIDFCEAHGYQMIHSWSSALLGWVLSERGNPSQAVAAMREALDWQRSLGSHIMRPHFLALVAEALAKDGKCEEGLAVLAEAMEISLKSGDCYYEAELRRLKGELLLTQATASRADADDAAVEAETCYRQAIGVARHQQARLLELRAATSLGRLYLRLNRPAEAREAVAGIYGWFSEGFNTPDLRDARRILNDLS